MDTISFLAVFFHSLHRYHQERRNSGRAGEAVKELRAIEAYIKQKKQKQKKIYKYKTKKSLPINVVSVQQQCWPQTNTRNYRKPF